MYCEYQFKVHLSFCSGNGYCRSEAAVVVLLTKRSVAKRVYATVLNAGNNTDGYKEQGEEEEHQVQLV